MKITPHFGFPYPIWCVDDFFEHSKANEILEECIGLKDFYQPAKVFGSQGEIRLDGHFRRNDVLYISDLVSLGNESKTVNSFDELRRNAACLNFLNGYPEFKIFALSNWSEMVISRYGDGAFYKKHTDVDPSNPSHRLLTVVYYVNRLPQIFTGGEICFHADHQTIALPSVHNRAVFFPSNVVHEVREVRISEDTWERGRFSINFWMGFSNNGVHDF